MNFNRGFDELHSVSTHKLLLAVKILLRLIQTCALWRPKILYFTLSLDLPALIRDVVFVTVARVLGVSRLIHVRGSGLRERAAQNKLIHWLYRYIFSGAKVIVLAPSLYEQDFEPYVSRDCCVAVANGRADPYRTDENPPDRRERTTVPHILFLSNLFELKGPLVLLDVLGELKSRDVSFTAGFVGPVIEEGLQEKIDRKVAQHGLKDIFTQTGGVYGEEKKQVFQHADIFAFPSLREAFGVVLIEAGAHQLPVVAFREGGIPDVIADGETGLLADKGNVQEMADHLEALLGDPNKRHEMGKAARKRFTLEFTQEAYCQNVLEKLLSYYGTEK